MLDCNPASSGCRRGVDSAVSLTKDQRKDDKTVDKRVCHLLYYGGFSTLDITCFWLQNDRESMVLGVMYKVFVWLF